MDLRFSIKLQSRQNSFNNSIHFSFYWYWRQHSFFAWKVFLRSYHDIPRFHIARTLDMIGHSTVFAFCSSELYGNLPVVNDKISMLGDYALYLLCVKYVSICSYLFMQQFLHTNIPII